MSESDLREAWFAGFMTSGEGWNGEWPFENPRRSDAKTAEQDARLEDQFQSWLKKWDR